MGVVSGWSRRTITAALLLAAPTAIEAAVTSTARVESFSHVDSKKSQRSQAPASITTCSGGTGKGVGGRACSDRPSPTAAEETFRSVRRLLAVDPRSSFSRKLLQLREARSAGRGTDGGISGGPLGMFLKRNVVQGEVLMQVPVSRSLWRGTLDLPSLGVHPRTLQGAQLSDGDHLMLWLAALLRRVARGIVTSGFDEYARGMLAINGCGGMNSALGSDTWITSCGGNSTVLWTSGEVDWLRGTEAGELTGFFLSRVSQVHSAAPHVASVEELRVASAHLQKHQLHLWLGGSALHPQGEDVVLLPGINLCRGSEGALRPIFDTAAGVVRLVAAAPMRAGEEVFVDYGPVDLTERLVSFGEIGEAKTGVFLPLRLDRDLNGVEKARLLEIFGWPVEARVVDGEVRDIRSLRLASMPPEEFSAWSVGALAAGVPLAVSRAFRSEVRAASFVAEECASLRAEAVAATPKGVFPREAAAFSSRAGGADIEVATERMQSAQEYRRLLLDSYERCHTWGLTRLEKLRRWASRQEAWVAAYVEEGIWKATHAGGVDSFDDRVSRSAVRLLAVEPPAIVGTDLPARFAYASIVALVNSRILEFVPYFSALVRAAASCASDTDGGHAKKLNRVRGSDVDGDDDGDDVCRQHLRNRLQSVRQLAINFVRLRSRGCGEADLTPFAWINGLHTKEELFAALKHLLVETERLVHEFADFVPELKSGEG
eukprot:TRINITY_DN23647_c0_g1_i1.p1 TRINITY_DN23647_c0_g1~~TRINITY_DN23647_c0_g1_i1.p1  ORF type:complete len:722 (+),score=119.77 TRINITY_DN23647_c0_g1_i1:23-2167(+)